MESVRSYGSMWMSLARSLTACWSSELTSRMIGASSVASRRSVGSWLISVASASIDRSARARARTRRPRRAATGRARADERDLLSGRRGRARPAWTHLGRRERVEPSRSLPSRGWCSKTPGVVVGGDRRDGVAPPRRGDGRGRRVRA